MIVLNAEWTELMRAYEADHSDPRNQACHKVGIPLIAASIPVGATIIGLPLATAMFTTGWTFQFVGHYFEGKKPSFVDDRRNLIVGLLWWLKKSGVDIQFTETAAPSRPSGGAAVRVSSEVANDQPRHMVS